jgi:hypothetical protein
VSGERTAAALLPVRYARFARARLARERERRSIERVIGPDTARLIDTPEPHQ